VHFVRFIWQVQEKMHGVEHLKLNVGRSVEASVSKINSQKQLSIVTTSNQL
jgi:hypothetical protein